MRCMTLRRALGLVGAAAVAAWLAGCSSRQTAGRAPTQAEVANRVQQGLARINNDSTKTPEEKEKLRSVLLGLAAGAKTESAPAPGQK